MGGEQDASGVPVDAMFMVSEVAEESIGWISVLHISLVFSLPLGQGSSSHTNVLRRAICAWNGVDAR